MIYPQKKLGYARNLEQCEKMTASAVRKYSLKNSDICTE